MVNRKARVDLFRDGFARWLIALCLLVLTSCGGGGSSSSTSSPSPSPSPPDTSAATVQQGVFLDSPVSGLRYQTATLSGLTGAGGVFQYRAGETVSFFLQNLPLGQAPAGAVLTPIEMVPGAQDKTHPKVTNLCILLQSLDEDGNPENGIILSATVRNAVGARSINLDQPTEQFTGDPEVTGLLEVFNGPGVLAAEGGRKLRTIEEARQHLRATLANLDRDGDGFSRNQGDCNDRNAEVHPDALESCGDGLDQDCDGADLACFPDEQRTWYLDTDRDRYASGSPLTALERPGADYFEASQLLAISGDCDDTDAGVHPGAAEACGDGLDQDCQGGDLTCPPADLSLWYRDRDGDRHGDGTVTEAATRPGSSYFSAGELIAASGDCNDTNAGVHPGAAEVCGDGLDQDCQGGDLTCPPEERLLWYRDRDGDRHGDGTVTEAATRPGSSYFSAGELIATSGDCNDTDAGRHPGAAEVCGDGIDQDCSGTDLACAAGGESSFDSRLRELISTYRGQNGLGPLAFDA
ncbi:MAG TPA: putative metal-binding motif-containing protein, partial [Desulfuromonadales bacterium]